ncbi:unnamed protein product [Calypogeia fissa]
MGPHNGAKVSTFSISNFLRRGTDDAEAGSSSSSTDGESTDKGLSRRPERRGNESQIHPFQPHSGSSDGGSDSSSEMKTSPVKPAGILKSGITSIYKGHAPPLPSSLEVPLAPRMPTDRNSVDIDVSHELIDQRKSELARNQTRKLSSDPMMTNYPIQDRGRSSSSSSQSEDSPSSNQSGISSSHQSEAKEMIITQIQQINDSNLQQSTTTRSNGAPVVDSPVGPPPPCSQCNNDQHSGYCNQLRRFSSVKLSEMTNGYSTDNTFGYQHEYLYKGNLDGQRVYVVRRESHEKLKVFSEVNILGSLRHPNIATLIGYCDEENHLALVFDFVCNRNLSFHLDAKNPKPMQWPHRANLAVQLAKGLVYLHDSSIIHGNVNSKYVFLHRDFRPLIAQFSIARKIKDGHEVIHPDRSGDEKSRGYLAPEYEPGGVLSKQDDVYAFGVILFELISGCPAFVRRNKKNIYLGEWGRETVEGAEPTNECNLVWAMVDPRLKTVGFDQCDVLRMTRVAALCTKKDPKRRPLMAEVLEMLTGDIDHSHAYQSPASSEEESDSSVVSCDDSDGPVVSDHESDTHNQAEPHEIHVAQTESLQVQEQESMLPFEIHAAQTENLQVKEQEQEQEQESMLPFEIHAAQTENLQVKEQEQEQESMLPFETEIEQCQTPEQQQEEQAARGLRVHWADEDAMETGRTLQSENYELPFRKSGLPLSEMAGKFLREFKAACELNKFLPKVPVKPNTRSYRFETYEGGSFFNYYQGRITSRRSLVRPPPSPARTARRPPTPGHRFNRNRSPDGNNLPGQQLDGDSSRPSVNYPAVPSSPRRVSLANSGGIPVSPLRVDVIIRYYERRSLGVNSARKHGKRVKFETHRPWPMNVFLPD